MKKSKKQYDSNKVDEFVYHMKHLNLKHAYELAEKYIEEYPKDSIAKLYKAQILARSDRKAEAFEIAYDAMRFGNFVSSQATSHAYTLYGDVLHLIGHDIDAIEAYKIAISFDGPELEKHPVRAVIGLVNVLVSNGRYEEAVTEIDNAQEDYKDRLNLQYALVKSCTGRYEEAIELLENLEDKDRNSFTACRIYGNCYFGLGEYKKAIKMYKRMVDNKANNYITVLPNLARAYANLGELEVAQLYAQKLYDLGQPIDDVIDLLPEQKKQVMPKEVSFILHNELFGIPDLGAPFKPEYVKAFDKTYETRFEIITDPGIQRVRKQTKEE